MCDEAFNYTLFVYTYPANFGISVESLSFFIAWLHARTRAAYSEAGHPTQQLLTFQIFSFQAGDN